VRCIAFMFAGTVLGIVVGLTATFGMQYGTAFLLPNVRSWESRAQPAYDVRCPLGVTESQVDQPIDDLRGTSTFMGPSASPNFNVIPATKAGSKCLAAILGAADIRDPPLQPFRCGG